MRVQRESIDCELPKVLGGTELQSQALSEVGA